MTDKQLSEVYDSIEDFEEFLSSVNSGQEILTEKLKVRFPDSWTVEITHTNFTETIPLDNFEKIKKELEDQWRSDKNFIELKKNKIYDREVNVKENGTFIITDQFVDMLTHGREISSGHGWYIKNLKQIIKLFDAGYILVHNNELTTNKHDFTDKYLKGLSGFKSLENELQ